MSDARNIDDPLVIIDEVNNAIVADPYSIPFYALELGGGAGSGFTLKGEASPRCAVQQRWGVGPIPVRPWA
jgi:hypothetical protein